MVENNQDNDEYQFIDPDVISPDALGGETLPESNTARQAPQRTGQKNVLRNALIVGLLAILAMLTYKFAGMFLSKKTQSTPVPAVVAAPKPQSQAVVEPTAPKEQESTALDAALTEARLFKQKITEMDLSQQDLRDDVTRLNNQLTGITTNINDLSSKMANLSQSLSSLSSMLEQQSKEIARLQTLQIIHKAPRPRVERVIIPRMQYFIQAIIPGRAWLIASNGSTMTVREGTKIPGYGMVIMIDAIQGLVKMSHGTVFKFSQDDS